MCIKGRLAVIRLVSEEEEERRRRMRSWESAALSAGEMEFHLDELLDGSAGMGEE